MKHYVTIQRTQKITYEIESANMRDAKEEALNLAENEQGTPYDVSDATYEAIACITYTELLHYLRQERNN